VSNRGKRESEKERIDNSFEYTKFPGVFVRTGSHGERTFFIRYRCPAGRTRKEKAVIPGVTMTASKAAGIRADRMAGKVLPNRERRKATQAAKEAGRPRWTIGKLWAEYVNQRFGGKPEQSDLSHYRIHLEKAFSKKEPRELVPLDADRVRVAMLKTHSPGTVAKALALLRRIVNFGVEKQLCPGTSFKIKLPKVYNERTESMSYEQMAYYLKAAHEWPNPIESAYVQFLLFTGCRRSEARRLQWPDVDMERGFVTLRNTKSSNPQTIPLNDQASDILRNIPRNEPNPHVFFGEGGTARGSKQLDTAARAIRDAAGLTKDFRPCHGLRHSFASNLASSGEVDLYTIQRLMTHKSPLMTQRYAHLRDETLKRGSNVMSRVIRKAQRNG